MCSGISSDGFRTMQRDTQDLEWRRRGSDQEQGQGQGRGQDQSRGRGRGNRRGQDQYRGRGRGYGGDRGSYGGGETDERSEERGRGRGNRRGQDQYRGRGRGYGGDRGSYGGGETYERNEERGRGRGRGRGQGPRRRYDDTGDFESMINSEDVRLFCKSRNFYQNGLDAAEFTNFVHQAATLQRENHAIRHQFLIKLSQTKFLEMPGPLTGTVTSLMRAGHVPDDYLQGLNELLDLMEEMLARIPHCRNTQPYITTMLGLMQRLRVNEPTKLKIKVVQGNLADPKLLLAKVNDPTQSWSSNISFISEPIVPEVGILLNEELESCYVNPIKGSYQSSAHYLETWFRLMREDFLGPLRTAIKDFTTTFKPEDRLPRRVRIDGGYHYTIERVVQRDVVEGQHLCLVEYSQEELKHVNWDTTDRLRSDSMMVMSNDHFQTARCATITYHDSKPHKRGQQIWIRMMGGPLEMDWFHAIEPMAFYEPTRCVLERVKVVAARVQGVGMRLPMSRYLVETRKDVNIPAYMSNGYVLKLPGETETSPQNPDVSALGLDFSQEEAMKLALTHEFALIQGPPGTGKSYVGAMFVHVMMLNKHLWQTRERGCMLLLAYKNHAIDQFIGECERAGMDMSRTVRIGTGSSHSMDKYLLRNRRRELPDAHEYLDLNFDMREKRKQLVEAEEKIEYFEKIMDTPNKDMPLDAYGYFIPGHILYQLGYNNDGQANQLFQNIVTWLIGNDQDVNAVYYSLDDIAPIDDEYIESPYFQYLDINIMPVDKRRALYVYWCEATRDEAERILVKWQLWRTELTRQMQRLRQEQDFAVVRRADIIATTTTAASKHGHLIDAVKPTIVLCEEAAEVLESHIVAPLTEGCQHVVLIGDHQQLRPSVNNFAMEKRNLSISLFERLIINEVPSRRLEIQHRMHPTIGDLLVPHIYSSLQHHPCVLTYPEVKGIKQRMHFFQHNNPEQKIGEKSSCRNRFEADYLVHLCHYLLKQGYQPQDITILTTYMGQMREIKERIHEFIETYPEPKYTKPEADELIQEEFGDYLAMQKRLDNSELGIYDMDNKTRGWYFRRKREHDDRRNRLQEKSSKLQNVRVTTVDNYQGEECTIILLSFVRSNKENNIGFLKWANRICVALSRAKHGFYAVGDFKLFAQNKKSDLWKKLCTQLLSKPETMLSEKFEMRCPVHETIRVVERPEMFLELSPLGGCLEPCDHRLECGHTCEQLCHPTDRDHKIYVCKKPCQGRLDCEHVCSRRCDKKGDDRSFSASHDSFGKPVKFRECKQCSKQIRCQIQVDVTPDSCGHTGRTECGELYRYQCQRLVPFLLDCGHSQQEKCFKNQSDINCRTLVTETLECGHEMQRQCHNENPRCQVLITKVLVCGHALEMRCYQQDELIECTEMVTAVRECGHKSEIQCNEGDFFFSTDCLEQVIEELKCGHKKEVPCCKVTGKMNLRHKLLYIDVKCQELITVTLPCNHDMEVRCCDANSQHPEGKANVIKPCEVLKQEVLKCGHIIQAPCCDFDKIERKGCTTQVSVSNLCGHQSRTECRFRGVDSAFAHCRKKCLLSCSHKTLCPRQCRQQCRRCEKPCQNQCPHNKCTKLCYEECNREPCTKPCQKKLNCGHKCEGLCGELCPTGCAKCRQKGKKKRAKQSRIPILPCNHAFTVKELDKHMSVKENDQVVQVEVKYCKVPQCKSVISHCPRYANQIKRYQRMIRMPGFTDSSVWWYCKQGSHFLGCRKEETIDSVADHDCDDFPLDRPDNLLPLEHGEDYEAEDEDLPEARAPADRPVGLADSVFFQGVGRGGMMNNPFFQGIGRGGLMAANPFFQGVGRGMTAGGFGAGIAGHGTIPGAQVLEEQKEEDNKPKAEAKAGGDSDSEGELAGRNDLY